ncbi:MAG TPA: CPBP family intramembrane glutamic endopeptidase [Luteimonas sp.]|nr:CPBP family intramembrane glutamic endopeptidase [Luteimonas sp.]
MQAHDPTPPAATAAPRRAWAPDLKIAATWGVLAALSTLAVLPYLRQLTPQAFEKIPVSFPVLAAAQSLQALVLLGGLALLGLRMGHVVGLGSPLLRALVLRERVDWTRHRPLSSLALGVLAALAIVAASALLDPMLPKPLHPPAQPGAATSALNGLLASFYGGIAEELQMRLFLMTLVVWLCAAAGRRPARDAMYWTGIVVAALLFGAGHLPAAHQVWGLSAIVVVRTVALNAIGGLAFGWLYWKRGIEMAMLGHFGADLVLHVLAPLLAQAPQ